MLLDLLLLLLGVDLKMHGRHDVRHIELAVLPNSLELTVSSARPIRTDHYSEIAMHLFTRYAQPCKLSHGRPSDPTVINEYL